MVLLRKRVGIAVFTLLVGFAPANPARADVSAADKAAADDLFEQGRRLLDEGKPAEACPRLEESQRLDPAAGTALNLGECYERIGRTASAYGAFNEAATLARRTGDTARAEEADRRARALEPKLAKLVVLVPEASRVQGLSIVRDGRPLSSGLWGTAVPLDPGEHIVEATAPGKPPWKTTAKLVGPGTVQVTVPSLAQTAKLPSTKGRTAQRIAGIVVGSTGLAALGVGVGLSIAATTTDTESKKYCLPDDPNKCYAKGVALRNEAITYADTATVVTSIGAVALASGITLFLIARTPRSPDKPAQAWVLVPLVSPRTAGFTFGAVF